MYEQEKIENMIVRDRMIRFIQEKIELINCSHCNKELTSKLREQNGPNVENLLCPYVNDRLQIKSL